ncbi:MAG: hypothetical protein LBT00_09910, partial [Spirochaetaceae bacterium]|nr:hypothetical protein [Spirochaetaceae bacterium]
MRRLTTANCRCESNPDEAFPLDCRALLAMTGELSLRDAKRRSNPESTPHERPLDCSLPFRGVVYALRLGDVERLPGRLNHIKAFLQSIYLFFFAKNHPR